MAEQVNKDKTKDAKQAVTAELTDDQLDEAAGGETDPLSDTQSLEAISNGDENQTAWSKGDGQPYRDLATSTLGRTHT